jgi:hypothetical protein
VRVSSTSRSAGWISTEYKNQSSPSTFVKTFGSEETVPELTLLLFPIALAAPFVVKYMKQKRQLLKAYA